ncbi:MAG: helix-turn-helix domain-containing protein [Polyangia bacterium]
MQAEGVGSGASTTIGPYLSAREVANLLRVSTITVYRLCETGQLPHVRVCNAIRVGEGDLRRYLEDRTTRTR